MKRCDTCADGACEWVNSEHEACEDWTAYTPDEERASRRTFNPFGGDDVDVTIEKLNDWQKDIEERIEWLEHDVQGLLDIVREVVRVANA